MSIMIGAMPQSIYQPLGPVNLPNTELSNLSFDSYQQKQEEELRVDPAVEARQIQQQRAEDLAASHDPASILKNIQSSADTSPVESLQDLFQRQQLMQSVAAGESKALGQMEFVELKQLNGAEIAKAYPEDYQHPGLEVKESVALAPPEDPARPLNPAAPPAANGGAEEAFEIMKEARADNHEEATDPEVDKSEAQEADKTRKQQEAQQASDESQERADMIAEQAENFRKGEYLSKDGDDEKSGETAQGVMSESTAPYRAAIERAATLNQSLSEEGTSAPTGTDRSPLSQQIPSENFIADIQRMQAMQFGTNHGRQLSTAA